MGRTACTEPQCLYKGDLYLFLTIEVKKDHLPLSYALIKNAHEILRDKWSEQNLMFNISTDKSPGNIRVGGDSFLIAPRTSYSC